MSSEICNIFQRGNHSAPVTCSMLCKSRCCSSSPQEKFCVVSSAVSMRSGWMVCTEKVREKVTKSKAVFEVELKMRRLERTLGMRRPRGRWAIMAIHKGVVGTASGNQATTVVSFIIWALMLLAGSTTEKSYTHSRPATERKTVPSPVGRAVSA